MLYLFLADGFETIEALAPLDLLRRAAVQVQTVGVTGRKVQSAHQVTVTADLALDELTTANLEGILLPGGGEGTQHLDACQVVHQYLDYCYDNKLLIAAICAAPSIVAKKGYLKGRNATAFPSFQHYLDNCSADYVVTDGNFITARGAGVSLEFGFAIIRYLQGAAPANEIKDMIQCIK